MTGTDGLGIEGDRVRTAVDHIRMGLGIRGVHIQVVAGNDEQVIPELLGKILLLVNLGIQALHHPDNGGGLFRAFGPVRNVL